MRLGLVDPTPTLIKLSISALSTLSRSQKWKWKMAGRLFADSIHDVESFVQKAVLLSQGSNKAPTCCAL